MIECYSVNNMDSSFKNLLDLLTISGIYKIDNTDHAFRFMEPFFRQVINPYNYRIIFPSETISFDNEPVINIPVTKKMVFRFAKPKKMVLTALDK